MYEHGVLLIIKLRHRTSLNEQTSDLSGLLTWMGTKDKKGKIKST